MQIFTVSFKCRFFTLSNKQNHSLKTSDSNDKVNKNFYKTEHRIPVLILRANVSRTIMYSYVLLFVLLLAAFITSGSCDPNTEEATSIALETSGKLLAPQSVVQKIAEDLKTIRAAYPQVKDVVHSAPWVVGELIAKLSDAQFGRILLKYGPVTSSKSFGEYKLLKFTEKYNPVVLAKELTAKNLVTSAEPNNIVGGGDRIRYQAGVYEFSHGWGDCPSGCLNRHYWKFSVSPSGAKLISESGSPTGADEI